VKDFRVLLEFPVEPMVSTLKDYKFTERPLFFDAHAYSVHCAAAEQGERPVLCFIANAQYQQAYDLDGRQLWRYEDPEGGEPLVSACRPCIYDLDGDGRKEIYVGRYAGGQLRLCAVDLSSGKLLRHVPWPRPERASGDRSCMVSLANIRGLERPSDLVVTWDYTHVSVLDDALNLLWEERLGFRGEAETDLVRRIRAGDPHPDEFFNQVFTGFGHSPAMVDIDADGRDELVLGYTVLDHDGSLIWSRGDLVRSGMDDLFGDHLDQMTIADVNDDGELELFASSGAILMDSNGRVIWNKGHLIAHGQQCTAGRFLPDMPGLQLLVLDQRLRIRQGYAPLKDRSPDLVIMYDRWGHEIWARPANQFAVGDWDGDGQDEILLVKDHAIDVCRPDGEVISSLPHELDLSPSTRLVYLDESAVPSLLFVDISAKQPVLRVLGAENPGSNGCLLSPEELDDYMSGYYASILSPSQWKAGIR